MTRLTLSARAVVVALALVLIGAAPAAAAQPSRVLITGSPFTHYPAGTGCDFDVTVYRPDGGWVRITDFSDGHETLKNHVVHRTITNDANGKTFVENSDAHESDVFDGNLIRGSIEGAFISQFYPGDMGPDGTILDHLLALYVRGRATYVVDGDTGTTLQVSIVGTMTDICAAIS